MTMAAGSVVVADDGTTPTHTGMAAALYDQFITMPQSLGLTEPVQNLDGLRGLAALANALAAALVSYIVANALAVIPNTASGDGLQRTPNPNDPDTNTVRPSATKFLTIV